jgi:hypothetical protein
MMTKRSDWDEASALKSFPGRVRTCVGHPAVVPCRDLCPYPPRSQEDKGKTMKDRESY